MSQKSWLKMQFQCLYWVFCEGPDEKICKRMGSKNCDKTIIPAFWKKSLPDCD